MSTQVTRIIVKDKTLPKRPVMTVGRIFPIMDKREVVAATVDREEDEKSFEDEAEVKVVRRGRRPKAQANEDAETK